MGADNKHNEKIQKIIDTLNKSGKLDSSCTKLLTDYASSLDEKAANEKNSITDKSIYLDQILLEKLMFKLEELQSQSKKYKNTTTARSFRDDLVTLLKCLRVLSRNGNVDLLRHMTSI